MRSENKSSQVGVYTGYEDLLAFFKRKSQECPKGVTLKLVRQKEIQLQFMFPDTGKRSAKPCNVKFTEEGVIMAIAKAHKVAEALKKFSISSEFCSWYDKEILEKNEIENDLKTYREIFKQIEDKYFNGYNPNTKRPRSRDEISDQANYRKGKGRLFEKFPNWDSYPNWPEIESVLFSWKQGEKSFKNNYYIIREICELSANSEKLLAKLEKIDPTQVKFKDKQSISIDEFLNWYEPCYSEIPSIKHRIHRAARVKWLWVTSMVVVYGLRPTEIASARNLTQAITIDGVHFKAISDRTNKDMFLVLGDRTYFAVTVKTGNRICVPMIPDKNMLERLHIYDVDLPIYTPEPGSLPETICGGFDKRFTDNIDRWNCPISEAYAFRHLANQQGEMYGMPQEIRARSLGHSVAVNDKVYKSRKNTKTTVNLLTRYAKQPLPLDMAKQQLSNLGFNLDDPGIKSVLRVIYTLQGHNLSFWLTNVDGALRLSPNAPYKTKILELYLKPQVMTFSCISIRRLGKSNYN
ncbi:MAG TPA: hypothetical protein V6C58_21775 [Allocoleopsis sp.]